MLDRAADQRRHGTREIRMFSLSRNAWPGTALGLAAVTVALVGFNVPGAVGVDDSSRGQPEARRGSGGHAPAGSIVRVGRSFNVGPHSLATNQLVRCPRG